MSDSIPSGDSNALGFPNMVNLQQVADLNPNILFVVDIKEYRIIYINKRAEELLEQDIKEIYSKGKEIFKIVIHPDDYGRRMQNLERCKEIGDGEETVVEVRMQSANKQWQWFKITEKVYQRDENGAVIKVIGTAHNIHSQKFYEDKLKEEHRKYKNAQAIGHIGSFERKLPGNQVTYSEEFYRILGLEPKQEEITAEEFMSHVHPEDREIYKKAIEHTHATGEPLDLITRIIRPDASIRYVHRRAAIVKDEAGNPVRVYGTAQDITERILAEKDRKKTEWLMHSTEKVAATGSYKVNLDTNNVIFSDGLYRLFGEEPGDFKPSTEWLDQRSHPDDAVKVQKILQNAIENKEPYKYTRRIYRRDGEMRVLEAQGNVLVDAEGNAENLIGLVQDITERKAAEEELRKSEQRSRNLLNVLQQTPDSYLIVGSDLHIEMVSDAYLQATFTNRKDLVGQYIFDVFPDTPGAAEANKFKNLRSSLEQVLSTKQPHRMAMQQYNVQRQDGGFEEKFWSPVNAPVLNAEGEVEYIIHRVLDVTEVVRKQESVQGLSSKTEMLKTSLEEIRLQAEQLREGKALLQSVFDASPYSIVLYRNVYNKNGRVEDFEIVMVNSYTFKKTGREKSIIGKKFSEVFQDTLKTGVLHQYQNTAETGIPTDLETCSEGLGVDQWWHVRASKKEDYLIATVEDITPRKRSEETLSQMFNGSYTAITMLDSIRDEEGKIIDFIFQGGNKAAEDITGFSTKELEGKLLLKVWPKVKDDLFDMSVKVVESGDPVRIQRYYSDENYDHWFDISASRNGDGLVLTFHDITEHKKAEQELVHLKEKLAQKATDKYRKIINSMDEGYCLIEIIRDDTGKCIDYCFLETNPVFEEQTGLQNVIGRKVNELVSNLENYWKEIYGNVALTGKSIRFEDYAEGMNRWFDVNAFRIDAPNEQHVAIIFKDVTERKKAEERQTFLLELTDSLSPIVDPQEIICEATRLVGEHFNSVRVYYYEIDENGWATLWNGFSADGNSNPPKFPVSDFGEVWLEAFKSGSCLIVGDVSTDERFSEEERKNWKDNGIVGGVGIPVVKDEKLITVLGVNNLAPHSWEEDEVKLLQEVAERTWAIVERAKIEKELKQNEVRLLQTMGAGNQFGWEVDLKTGKVTYSGDQIAVLGFNLPNSIKERLACIHPNDLQNFIKEYRKAIKDQSSFSIVQRLLIPGSNGKTVWTRMEGNFFGNPPKLIGTTRNINEEKKIEEQQAYLLHLSDALRTIDDPEEILYKAATILGEHLGAARVGYAEDMGDEENVAVPKHYCKDVMGIEGIYKYKDYGEKLLEELLAGETIIQHDINNNPKLTNSEKEANAALDLAATVNVPLIKKEKLYAILFVHFKEAHIFSKEEITLIEETADRTWAAVERARAEKALREAQESLHIALEAAQMGTWILDLTNGSSKRNFRHDQIFGYNEPQTNWNIEIAKKHVLPEDYLIYDEALAAAFKTGKFEFEVRVRWQDGSIHWMAVNGHFYFDEQGNAIGGAGVNFDVTERRQAELGLRESEQRFRNLVEASALAVWETNPEGEVVNDSPSWREFTGQTFEEWKETGWISVHPEDREAAIQNWKKAIRLRQNFDYEYRLQSANGDFRWTNIKAIPILDLEGKVTKWSGMNLDIHERKLTEEALRKAKEEAEAASRAKEDFLSTMSHEIRTPLNAIIGLTNLLLEQKPREDQKENLSSLSFSARNLLVLINDILDFSKLEAGKMELGENPFNLQDLLINLQKAHKPQAESHGTHLILNIDANIPAIIVTDQVKLSQILHNLVGNAVKFTRNGLVKISVELNRRDNDLIWLDFAVKDTGIGIAADKADHIFDKFAQAESSTVRNYGGTGLGLSITKLLLELLGSEIRLTSKIGEGSLFYFSLPVKVGVKKSLAETEVIIENNLNLRHIRILLVEDVEINRKIIMQFLQNWWMLEPDEATNGKEAVEKAEKEVYDLILMDVRMPEMDGYEATKKIRKISGYEKTPILALTADKNLEVHQEMQATQFSDMLTKPFDPGVLKARILQHLAISGKDISSNKDVAKDFSNGKSGNSSVKRNPENPPEFKYSEVIQDKPSFEVSRYKKISGGNSEIFEKLIYNAAKAFEIYKNEFKFAADEADLKIFSDLVHKNTTSVHYIQANLLARKIEDYRERLTNGSPQEEELETLKNSIIKEFDNIISGLRAMIKN